MNKTTAKADERRMIFGEDSVLDHVIRDGARKMLQAALDNEVAEYLEKMKDRRTEDGLRAIVRNGRLPERDIQSGVGSLRIAQPRVRDRKSEVRFSSQPDPAAVHAPCSQRRSAHSGALFEGSFDERFSGSPGGDSGTPSDGAFGDEYRPVEGSLAEGLRGLGSTRSSGQAIRLLVGGWDLLQCSVGTGSHVSSGDHLSSGRRYERASGGLGWPPGKRGLVEGSLSDLRSRGLTEGPSIGFPTPSVDGRDYNTGFADQQLLLAKRNPSVPKITTDSLLGNGN